MCGIVRMVFNRLLGKKSALQPVCYLPAPVGTLNKIFTISVFEFHVLPLSIERQPIPVTGDLHLDELHGDLVGIDTHNLAL